MTLQRDQWWALAMIAVDASLVLAWELFYAAAFAHSFGLYWAWYGIELLLVVAFLLFSYRWMTSTDLHRHRWGLAIWLAFALLVGWRVVVVTQRVVLTLAPIADARTP